MEAQTANQITISPKLITTNARLARWASVGGVLIIIAYVAFLLFARLDVYPAPNFDEGAFLKVAKNYAFTGTYADFSLGENRYTGAVVSTGPTVILPVALLFKFFGPSIILGRLVEVTYAILMLCVVFALGATWQNKRVGSIAIIVLLFLNRQHFEFSLRSLLGEIPGLFFTFIGLWLWLRTDKRRVIDLIIVGTVFGLGAMTKNQLAPIILGGIFLSWLVDLFWYHRKGSVYYIVPGLIAGLCYAGWTYYTLFLLGAHERNVASDFALLRSTTSSALFLINSTINNTNVATLIQDNLWLIPAVIYGLVMMLRKNEQEQRWGVLSLFALIAVVMFIFSTGWQRYEVTPHILAALLVARLICNLIEGFPLNWQGWHDILSSKPLSLAATITLIVMALLAEQIIRPLYLQITDVITSGTNAPYLVQQYLDRAVPQNATISTFESSLGVLTNHMYRFAPYSTVVDLTVKKPLGIPVTSSAYSFLVAQNPEYIVIGTFTESLDDTLPEQLQPSYDLVFEAGDYQVYHRKGQTF